MQPIDDIIIYYWDIYYWDIYYRDIYYRDIYYRDIYYRDRKLKKTLKWYIFFTGLIPLYLSQ